MMVSLWLLADSAFFSSQLQAQATAIVRLRPYRLMVRTAPFQGVNRSSILRRVMRLKNILVSSKNSRDRMYDFESKVEARDGNVPSLFNLISRLKIRLVDLSITSMD